ncbi:MAG: hypothetical protein AB8B84_16215 [Granulosicoccus sp.]
MKDFRKEHLCDRAYYVSCFEFDVINSKIKIVLLRDVFDTNKADSVEFPRVTKYTGEFDKDLSEDDCLEPLTDLMYERIEGSVSYLINFGAGEIQFQTSSEPVIMFSDA